MRVLRIIWKWLSWLQVSGATLYTDIDSHKWESKIEILHSLSDRRA